MSHNLFAAKARPLIAPSLLSSDFSKLGEEINAVESAGADLIHIDVMDGQFVPNLTLGAPVVAKIRASTKLPFDAHLMVKDPQNLIADFAKAGTQMLSVHAEACPHLHRTLQEIRQHKMLAGVALNPATSIENLRDVYEEIDFILIMSVNPGFGGQKFIPRALEKIRALAKLRKEMNLDFLIEVDGGVTAENSAELTQCGADILVAGTAVFKGGPKTYAQNIASLKEGKK